MKKSTDNYGVKGNMGNKAMRLLIDSTVKGSKAALRKSRNSGKKYSRGSIQNWTPTHDKQQSARGVAEQKDNDKLVFATDDFSEYSRVKFLKRLLKNGKSLTYMDSFNVKIPADKWPGILKALNKLHKGITTVAVNSATMVTHGEEFMMESSHNQGRNAGISWVSLYASTKKALRKSLKIINQCSNMERVITVHWIYDKQGSHITTSERFNETVDQSLYPYIKDFDSFAKRFWESKSNILILQGDPGTGKTTFIKHLLEYSRREAYVTYDASILATDSPFASFMGDTRASSFVIEDADTLLKPREDGNDMISRFLNIGDGIISLRDKKLIFSTNLKNIDDIDPALTREGRCFDIINFRHLTLDEAKVIAKNRSLSEPEAGKKDYTLAELFNQKVVQPKRAFGFIP